MIREEVENVVRDYISAYNALDVDGMMRLLHKDVVFR